MTAAAMALAGGASLWLLGRAVTDGRLRDSALCLVLALASAALWGMQA